jgi:uncharacterized protein (DUF1786 family)
MIDIGAGTMDILYFDRTSDQHFKAVVRSPVQSIADKAARLSGNLLITGCEMGGGPITEVLRRKARTVEVVMSASAAATLHHDPERVRSWGIRILADDEVESTLPQANFSHLRLADLELERIRQAVTGFDVPFAFDVVAVCAQDHGVAPPGTSHLDYRHQLLRELLSRRPYPDQALYPGKAVPKTMNRLRAIAETARNLPAEEVFVMDSGMAAVIGASLDANSQSKSRKLVLDIATSHTVGAALQEDALLGFFEYHTRDITLPRLESLLWDLAEGNLSHGKVLREGGHGAYIRESFGFDACEIIVATGPKRRLVENSRLPMTFGAPWGDNMMTGTVGLLEAVRRRKGMEPINYL